MCCAVRAARTLHHITLHDIILTMLFQILGIKLPDLHDSVQDARTALQVITAHYNSSYFLCLQIVHPSFPSMQFLAPFFSLNINLCFLSSFFPLFLPYLMSFLLLFIPSTILPLFLFLSPLILNLGLCIYMQARLRSFNRAQCQLY
jgi:hypothetical protein